MAIYRGAGGAGDATTDSTSQAIIAVEAAAEAQSSATAAASSASSASTSASNAATSATNAANSATAAQTAETNAETAEVNAETAQAAAEAAQLAAENARDASLNFGDSLSVQATTLSAGSDATVVYDSNDLIIEFGIPRGNTGATGATGPANTLSIGTVTSGSIAAATITGTAPNQTLNLTLPKGDTGAAGSNGTNGTNGTDGADGAAATIAVGTVTTGAAGSSVTVTNAGTSSAAVFNFSIPKGDKGDTGATGSTGATGATGPANTLTIGTVTSGASAAATITGTSPNQTLNLTLPKGDTGATGATGAAGAAATIAVGTTTTGAAGTSATVTNVGTSSAAVFNFTIPKGADGTGSGTVTSVGMSVPTGLSVTGSPVTSSGTFAVSLQSGYSIPTTASQTNWDTAYTDRNKWDGGATGLVAATGRTSLGLGTAATMTGPSGTIVGTTDTQTLTNKTFTGYTETVVTANTTTAYTINISNGTVQKLTLTGNCTYTFPTATAGQSFILYQLQDATGSRTVSWPASVKWPSGTAPTLTSTASKADVFAFTADGTNWIARTIGQAYL